MYSDYALWLIGWAYVLTNTGRVLSYLPQIAKIWRCRDGAPSISLITWSYWAFSHLTASLYAGAVIGDWKLLAVSLGNLASCATVVLLTCIRRRRSPRPPRQSAAAPLASQSSPLRRSSRSVV